MQSGCLTERRGPLAGMVYLVCKDNAGSLSSSYGRLNSSSLQIRQQLCAIFHGYRQSPVKALAFSKCIYFCSRIFCIAPMLQKRNPYALLPALQISMPKRCLSNSTGSLCILVFSYIKRRFMMLTNQHSPTDVSETGDLDFGNCSDEHEAHFCSDDKKKVNDISGTRSWDLPRLPQS